jgi:hypothetical protein
MCIHINHCHRTCHSWTAHFVVVVIVVSSYCFAKLCSQMDLLPTLTRFSAQKKQQKMVEQVWFFFAVVVFLSRAVANRNGLQLHYAIGASRGAVGMTNSWQAKLVTSTSSVNNAIRHVICHLVNVVRQTKTHTHTDSHSFVIFTNISDSINFAVVFCLAKPWHKKIIIERQAEQQKKNCILIMQFCCKDTWLVLYSPKIYIYFSIVVITVNCVVWLYIVDCKMQKLSMMGEV